MAEGDRIGIYKEFKGRVFKEICKYFRVFLVSGVQQSNQKDLDIVTKNLRKIAKSKTVTEEFKSHPEKQDFKEGQGEAWVEKFKHMLNQ